MMQEMQMKAEMKMQFALFNNCFKDCVLGFREDSLTQKEQTCIGNCATRELQGAQQMQAVQERMQAKNGQNNQGPQF